MIKRIKSIHKFLIPYEKLTTPEARRRAMTVINYLWLAAFSIFFFSLYYWFAGFQKGVIIISFSVIYLPFTAYLLKVKANFNWIAHLIGFAVGETIFLVSLWSGGIHSPAMVYYIMAIPLIFDIAGKKIGIYWSIAYFIVIAATAIIQLNWGFFPNEFVNQERFLFSFVVCLGIFLFLALFNYHWEYGRKEMELDLDEKRKLLIYQDKMASLGQLTAGIAHEINNPVNFVNGNAEALKMDIQDAMPVFQQIINLSPQDHYPPEIQQLLLDAQKADFKILVEEIPRLVEGINRGTDRIGEIIAGLKTFTHQSKAPARPEQIHLLIDSTLAILNNKLKEKQIELVKRYQALQPVVCHAGKINQVLVNILDNAIHASPNEGMLKIGTRQLEKEVSIQIRDQGFGMDEATQRRIFDPFFTTKEVGKGTGLGMAISYGIIQEHGGRIEIESSPNQGTKVTILLPNESRISENK